jgi:single-stranded-DNA-specific exonuclease
VLPFETMDRPAALRPYRWEIAPPVPNQLQQELGHLNPVLAQVLYNRGVFARGDIEAFLEGRYSLPDDPFLLPDVDRAVDRIGRALDGDEMIVVYGDFDADGVTATVLMVEALRGLGIDRRLVQPYIPDRVDEGYGLNKDALSLLKEKGAGLVITVDCGTRSIDEVAHANEIGLDLIISDHHSLGQRLPDALALINPQRPGSDYPETRLSGVGIAYKLAQALRRGLAERARFDESDLLDLVALGTVADLAPLLGENRSLVASGLAVLNEGRRPGIRALAEVSGTRMGSLSAETIAFALGPRINAAGRLAHAYDAARLLAVNNLIMARDYARRLDSLNRERQKMTRDLSRQAEAMIIPEAPLLFAAAEGFASGVVGLVASRLSDRYYRPAIVVEIGQEESRGSCRSIQEFHITQALDRVAAMLVRHGGHAQAAGFTIANENLPAFKESITAIAAEELDLETLAPTLSIDAEIAIGDIDWALMGNFERLEPTGYANAPPLLVSRDVQVHSYRAVGQDGSHLQLQVGDGRVKRPCIAFRQGAWAGLLPGRVDLVYSLGVNEWNGRRDLQLNVQDIRPAGQSGP